MAYIGKRPVDTFPAINAVTSTLIAENNITAREIATNTIVTSLIADNAVTAVKIAENVISSRELAANTVATGNIADNAVDGTKIAQNSILTRHIDDAQITTSHIIDANVTTAKIADVNVTTAKIADDAVTVDKMAGLARGKIIYGDALGNPAALGLGTSGQVLKSDGTDIAWGTDEGLTTEQVQDIAGGMFTGNTETGITATYQDADGTIDLVVGTLNQDSTGNAATATTLETARTIGGVSFDGSANISLPGVDAVGNQNTTGSAATLTTARTIGGVSFDGSANINLPGVNAAGSQDTSGTAALATSITASANNSTNETVYPAFVDGATGTQGIETDTGLTYNPLSGVLTTTSVTGNLTGNVTGNASGTAATVTGGTQAAITSAANLVTVGTIGTGVWQGTAIASGYIAADAITGAKIADDAINSEHYTDGSIDTAHIADDQVTAAKLANTTVTAASYGSSSAIPVITVDAQGRITAASTAATSSVLTIAADSGSNDTLTVGTDTLTFEGTANEIETTVSNNKINIGLPTNVTIAGNLTVAGTQTTVSSTTITVADPLVALASGNNAADAVDIGLYGLYDTSGSQDLYSGLFRDASDSGKWKLFKDTQAAPTTTVDTSGTGYAVGTLVANIEGNLTGNVTGNTSGTSGSTTGNAATATALATARTIHGVSFDGTANIDLSEVVSDTVGAMFSSNTETGITATYQDADNTIDLVVGTLNQDTTGNAATATALATARTIHGVSFDGSANIDLSEVVSDTVGAMFTSNTETNITATYQDLDNTIDLVVGTLNQDTTGSAATLTTARTIGGVSFDGSANISLPGVNSAGNQNTTGSAATLTTARTIGGVSFDGSANIDLPGVNAAGSQNTTGSAATLTTARAIAVAGDVTGTANFDGSAGISITTTLATDAIVTANITDANITTAKIATDAVTQAKIADDAVGADQLAANSVVSASIVNGSIVGADIAANTITVANIADNAVDATKIASNSILTRHIDDNQITGDQIADDIVLSGTGALRMPDGTTGQRPGSPAAGMFRYNTTEGKFEGYTDSWGEVGGGGSNGFLTDIFDGTTTPATDGSRVAFTMSQAVSDEKFVMVFVDGVYQAHSAYSVSGSTLTMADAPVAGRTLTVHSVSAAIQGDGLNVDNFSGDGLDTTFTLSLNPVHENNTQVYVDGVYQFKNTYSVSGTTLTFSTAPPNSSSIEVMTHSQTTVNSAASLNATAISNLSEVTIASADHVMIFDATDSALKKGLASDLIEQLTTEQVQDVIGAMVTSNTESGITVAYDDLDGTLDFTVGTLNQNTTGSAATLTTARTIGGVSFDGSANIDLPGVNSAGNQATSGLAGTATALATARTIGGVSFDGTANIVPTTFSAATFSGAITGATSAKITQVALTSSSAAVAWDATAAANAYHVTTENTTFSAPSNAVEGAIIQVELAQGGTARTIAWNTVFEFAASTAPTVTATANKTDIFTFRYNGSVWQEIGRVQNMAQT
jgi:hypothetical protein